MPLVKFSKDGKWADDNTTVDQFEVSKGDTVECSHELAEIIVNSNSGEIMPAKKSTPAQSDKKKAEHKGKKDKAESESK